MNHPTRISPVRSQIRDRILQEISIAPKTASELFNGATPKRLVVDAVSFWLVRGRIAQGWNSRDVVYTLAGQSHQARGSSASRQLTQGNLAYFDSG